MIERENLGTALFFAVVMIGMGLALLVVFWMATGASDPLIDYIEEQRVIAHEQENAAHPQNAKPLDNLETEFWLTAGLALLVGAVGLYIRWRLARSSSRSGPFPFSEFTPRPRRRSFVKSAAAARPPR